MNLVCVNIPLNNQIKRHITSTSNRVLNSGISISTIAHREWLQKIKAIDNTNFVLKSTTKLYQCLRIDQDPGLFDLFIKIKQDGHYISFEIDSTLNLYGNNSFDSMFENSILNMVTLKPRESKEIKPMILRQADDLLQLTYLDLVIIHNVTEQRLYPHYVEETGGPIEFTHDTPGAREKEQQVHKTGKKNTGGNTYPSKYGSQQPSYGSIQSYGSQQPSYGSRQPFYGTRESSDDSNQPFQSQQSSFPRLPRPFGSTYGQTKQWTVEQTVMFSQPPPVKVTRAGNSSEYLKRKSLEVSTALEKNKRY